MIKKLSIKQRIRSMISEYPCSAEFIADVLNLPVWYVQYELKKMEKRGRVTAKTLTTYKLVPTETEDDKRIESRIKLVLAGIAKVG